MEKVKIDANNRIILKDGKVSCTCCEIICPGRNPINLRQILNPTNIPSVGWANDAWRYSEITKEQYNKLTGNGRFLLSCNANRTEAADSPSGTYATHSYTCSGQLSFLKTQSCQQYWTGLFGTSSFSATFGEANYGLSGQIRYRIGISLKKLSGQYYFFYFILLGANVGDGGAFLESYFFSPPIKPIVNSPFNFNIANAGSVSVAGLCAGSSNYFGWTFANQESYSNSFSAQTSLIFTPN